MSRKTRSHPGRTNVTPTVRLVRIEAGAYLAPDYGIRIENRNDGKRDACWVAFRTNDGNTVCFGGSLREARKRLAKHLLVVVRADGKLAPEIAEALAKPWGTLHWRFARAALYNIAAELVIAELPGAAFTAELDFVWVKTEDCFRKALANTLGANLPSKRIEREVRNVRDFAEGRKVREPDTERGEIHYADGAPTKCSSYADAKHIAKATGKGTPVRVIVKRTRVVLPGHASDASRPEPDAERAHGRRPRRGSSSYGMNMDFALQFPVFARRARFSPTIVLMRPPQALAPFRCKSAATAAVQELAEIAAQVSGHRRTAVRNP